MIEQVVSIALFVCLAGYMVVENRRFRRENGSIGEALSGLAERIVDLKTTSSGPSDALERIEALERRVDTVHKDCLSYLQKAAAAENRMKQRLEQQEEQDTGELTEEQARQLLAAEQNGLPNRRMTRAEIERSYGG